MDQTNNNKISENDSGNDELENFEKPSYTYWKRESDNPFSNEFKPSKSDPNLGGEINNSSINTYGSAWNKAGTWEEKHFTKIQIEDFFNQYLQTKKSKFDDCCVLDTITSYVGDVFKN